MSAVCHQHRPGFAPKAGVNQRAPLTRLLSKPLNRRRFWTDDGHYPLSGNYIAKADIH